jgi:hypothetical protein
MNDALAMQTFRTEIGFALMCLDMPDAAVYFVPWSLLLAAINSQVMTRAARFQALEVAFRIFRTLYSHLDQTGDAFHIHQRGLRTEPNRLLTPADANQLRRAMNLCVALSGAMFLMDDVALQRIGTHEVEGHFGLVRTALQGQSQWRSWLSAEVFASLVPEFREQLGLARTRHARGRESRVGVRLGQMDVEGAFDEWRSYGEGDDEHLVELRDLLLSAEDFTEGRPSPAFFEYLAAVVVALGSEPEPHAPGPMACFQSQWQHASGDW